MELQSDFSKIKHLLNEDTEIGDIELIEFSEQPIRPVPVTKPSNYNTRVYSKNPYVRAQEMGNQVAESLSDNAFASYGMGQGQMDVEGSIRNRYGQTDLMQRRQNGGEADDMDSYEQDFYEIFNKARNYRQQILNTQSQMDGGQDGETKKRGVNPTLALLLELTKIMKESKKYPDIQQKHFMKISKNIIDEARRQLGISGKEITPQLKDKSIQLAKQADKFVDKFRNEAKQQNIGSQNFRKFDAYSSERKFSRNDRKNSPNNWQDDEWEDFDDVDEDNINRNERRLNEIHKNWKKDDLMKNNKNNRNNRYQDDTDTDDWSNNSDNWTKDDDDWSYNKNDRTTMNDDWKKRNDRKWKENTTGKNDWRSGFQEDVDVDVDYVEKMKTRKNKRNAFF